MILYTDIEPFCCEVLRARVDDGGLPPGDVWERDVRTLTADELKPYTQVHLFCGIGASPLGLKWAGWPADLSIVTGGFPCQDISSAGTGAGIDGARSGLWKEMHRVIDAVRPCWVIAENVPPLRTRGADRVLGDLERIGYDCWPLVVGADDVGAPHRRKRVWIVGQLGSPTCERNGSIPIRLGGQNETSADTDRASEGMAYAERDGCGSRRGVQRDERSARSGRGESAGGCGMANAPRVGRAEQGDIKRGFAADPCESVANADECGRRIDESGRGPQGRVVAWRTSENVGHAGRAGREERDASNFANPTRFRGWPVAPGQRQHEWEASRLIERAVGAATDGISGRLAGSWNRCALKAVGNAQVPQCVELIARGILQMENEHAL